MAALISKEAFKQKVVEGFIIGVMVSLTIAVCGIVWNAFDNATERLKAAEASLNGQAAELQGQSAKLQQQSDFNGALLAKLRNQQTATEQQLEQLGGDLQETRSGLEKKLTELATAVNKLPRAAGSSSTPTFAKSFGKFEGPIRFDPKKQELPDFRVIGREFKDIVKQEPLDR